MLARERGGAHAPSWIMNDDDASCTKVKVASSLIVDIIIILFTQSIQYYADQLNGTLI